MRFQFNCPKPSASSLESWRRAGKTEKRMVPRIQIVELAAQGCSSRLIASRLGLRRPTVLKWRQRFSQLRMAGLHDAPRSGPPRRYTPQPSGVFWPNWESPPSGRGRWNGRLLAQALGDVSADQVWAVLRQHGIQLQRRRSWCVSTDPEFARKAADIVGLWTRRWGRWC